MKNQMKVLFWSIFKFYFSVSPILTTAGTKLAQIKEKLKMTVQLKVHVPSRIRY